MAAKMALKLYLEEKQKVKLPKTEKNAAVKTLFNS